MKTEELMKKIMEDVDNNLRNTNEWHQFIEVNDLQRILEKHLPTQERVEAKPAEVEISKKELKAHCIWDEYWVVYWLVCLLLLSKWIKLSE